MTKSEQARQSAYRSAVAAFAVAVAGGLLAAIGYWTDNTDELLGLGLAAALLGIGFGLVLWAKYLDLDEHVVQAREPLHLTEAEREELGAEIAMTRETVGRRRLLVGLFGGSFASLIVGFIGPIGSLGPKPRGERGRTSWTAGARLVTSDGDPIDPTEGGFDQLVTVFPERYIGVDDSQVVLLRMPRDLLSDRTVQRGAVDGWVAYSKICTHAGCSVGLFGVDNRPPETIRQLVCPCHQSVFDPLDSTRPVGGPATRSLPQLPLDVDADGFLIARSDFDRPVGPIAWDEGSAPRSERRGLVERYVESVTGRVGGGSLVGKGLRKVFPNHFSFLWGELALYSFVVLLATGVYLTLFFEGSQEEVVYRGSYAPLRGEEVSAAYDSVLRISFDVKGGLLIRQMHHWAALVFIGALALHMARVFFTGAFRRPRDLNWVVGVLLLLLGLGAGFTGYSLPDDLLSGTGLRITHAIILALPFVGERLTYLIFGGEWPGTDIIGRLYPVHILLIPGLIVALLVLHLGLVWRQKHTQFRGPGRTEYNVIGAPVWPGFAMKATGLLFMVAGVITGLGALFDVNPIWLYGPYDTAAATSYSQPDWYIGFLEGSLRLFPPWETRIGRVVVNNVVYSGVLVSGLVFGALFVVPWIERRLTGDEREHHLLDRPRDAPVRTALGAAAITFVAILFLGGSQDVIAGTFDISIGHVTTILQVAALVAPPLAGYVTWHLCRELRDRPGPTRTERSAAVARDAGGGYHGAVEAGEPAEAAVAAGADGTVFEPVSGGPE